LKYSSLSRYNVIKEEFDKVHSLYSETDMINILSSHENKPYSPCRHPLGDVNGRTLSTAVIDFQNGSMKVYKGNPCLAKKDGLFSSYYIDKL